MRGLDRYFKFTEMRHASSDEMPKTDNVFAWIWHFTKPYKWELAFHNVIHLFRYVVFLSGTLFFTKIAELFEQGRLQDNPDLAFYILGGYFLINLFCYTLWVFLVRRISITDKITREFSMYAIRHYMGLSLSWHELSGSGGKMQRVMNARNGLFELFQTYFWDISEFIAVFISIYISVKVMDMPDYFIWPLFGFVITYFWLSTYTGGWLLKPTDKYFKRLEQLNSKVYEFVNSIATVKVFNLQGYLMRMGADRERHCHHAIVDVYKIRGLRWALTDILATSWIAGVAAFAYMEVVQGDMSISAFIMVMLFMSNLWGRMAMFTRFYGNMIDYFTALKRLVSNLCTQTVIADNQDAQPLTLSAGAIDFSQLEFYYDEQNPVLSDFNLNISGGEKVGLIGRSGAGKTTLVKMLVRFYDPESGSIKIDGQEISDVTLESLREKIAIIPQDIALFNHSILDNIRYGRLDASDEEVIEAARRAHADEFINRLPEGYNTMVGERGVKLSGGQRQRVAIARAILKNAPILILDEATSALDSESERLIQQSLHDLMTGKTVIAIAHRLSTIKSLDRVIVMEDGEIKEQGPHDELIATGGIYADLWDMQSGGFIGGDAT